MVSGRPGRRPDEQKALTPEQEIQIKRLITKTCPDQLGLPFALWTREAVGLLIERETGVRLVTDNDQRLSARLARHAAASHQARHRTS